jgi:NAD(P)-dependent dehydrogenase (short-subunit alcohol dehydrogenase family)
MSEVWLITGASRGLSRAFTEEAIEAGHRVVATGRNSQQLVEVTSKFGESVRTVSLDVTNEGQASLAKYAVDAAIQTLGGRDVLVNNAGYGNVCPVEDTSLADFRAQIETNLFGVIIMTKAVLPHFREQASGHTPTVASYSGRPSRSSVEQPAKANQSKSAHITCEMQVNMTSRISFTWDSAQTA